MKKFKRKCFKTVLATVSCLSMAATLVPVSAYAASDTNEADTLSVDDNTGKEIFDQLTNMGSPEDYDEDSKSHPYGYGNNPTVAVKNSNLMLASSSIREMYDSDSRQYTDVSHSYWLLSGYKKGGAVIYRDTAKNWSESKISKNGTRMSEYAYLSAVSFDPDGDGLRDIIAYIGVKNEGDDKFKVGVWTLDTNTGLLEDNETFLGDATWVGTGIGLDSYTGQSYFSITAGDYNADGKDTLVAYACLDGNNYGIFELSYESGSISVHNTQADQTLLHPGYNANTDLHKEQDSDYYTGYKLKGQVITGDLNNDGIDDLVATSGIGITNSSVDKEQVKEGYVAVSVGQDGMSESPISKSDDGIYISDDDITISNLNADIGNVFGDGNNRLIVSGHKLTKDSSGTYQYLYQNENQKTTMTRTYFYELKNGKLKQCNNAFDLFAGCETYNSFEGPVPVCSACVDGYGQQEQLFINGSVYKIESNGNFKEMLKDFDGYASLLYDAVAVTVDDNNRGIEQFAISYLGENSNSDYMNSAKCSIIYGNASYDDDGVLKPSESCTADVGWPFDKATYYSFKYETNILMVPYENSQDDVILVRLNNKGYFYSNPEPVVVLQAAPYFSELGGENSGMTQYSLTASYTQGTGTTTNSSIGGGFAETFFLGTVLRQTFNLNYKSFISDDFKKSEKESYTTTFTATSQDTVVIQSTPVVYYSYDVYDPSTGEWEENQMGLTFAEIPVYTQITVDQYNSFVEYYNDYIENHPVEYTYGGEKKTMKAEALNSLDTEAYYLDNAGTPDEYCQTWADLPNGSRASKASMALGYQGGSTTSNYGYETSETTTHTTGWTIDESLNIQVGGMLTKLVGLWVGGTINHSSGSSTSTFETTGNGYSISGTVKNLNVNSITKSGQFPESSVKAYNFQWTFGMSDFSPHTGTSAKNNSSIPVACYVVNNVTRGIPSPKITSLETTGDQTIEINWTAPEANQGQTIEGYNVYLGDLDGNYQKITDKSVSADTLSYEYTPENKTAYYTFVVTAVGKTGTSKDIESLPSNTKSTIYSPQDHTQAEAVVWATDGTNQKYDGTAKSIQASSLPQCDTVTAYYSIDENGIVGDRVEEPTDLGKYMYVITLKDSSTYKIENALSENESDFVGKSYDELDASNIGVMTITENVQPDLTFDEEIIEKTYGDAAFTNTPSGGVANAKTTYEVVSGSDIVSVSSSTGEVTIKKPGLATIKATKTATGYEDVTATYVVSISKKMVTITLPETTDQTFTGSAIDIPFTVSGDVDGNKIKSEDILFTYTNADNLKDHSHVNAGEYYVTAKIPAANEYYMTDGEISGILDIVPKTIVVTPDKGQSKTYSQADPDFTYTTDGLVNDDALEGKLGRESGEDAGTYAFTLGTLQNSNYTLQLDNHSPEFTINKAEAGLSFASSSVSKDTNDRSFTNTLTKKTDAAITYTSGNTDVAEVSSTGVVTIKGAGTTTITASAPAANNYEAGSASYTLTVEQVALIRNGIYLVDGQYLYYINNVRQHNTGIVQIDEDYYYLVDGVVTPNTIAKDSTGCWRHIDENGKVDFDYEGIPSPTITTLEATENQTIVINWVAPTVSQGQTVEGYNVYLGNTDGYYQKITETPLSADTLSYEFTTGSETTYYAFVVTAVGKSGTSETLESLPSNEKSTIYSPQDHMKTETVVWASNGTNQEYDGTAKSIQESSLPQCETLTAYYSIDENGIIGNRVEEPTDLGKYMYVITLKDNDNYEIKNALSDNESEFIGKSYDELGASNIGIMNITENIQPDMTFEEEIIEKTYGDSAFVNTPSGGMENAAITYEVAGGSDVVSVDSSTGEVTIKKSGLATIKATKTADGYEDVTATYVVSVSKKLVTINLPETTEQIFTGSTIDMPFAVSGDVDGNKIASGDITFTYTNANDLKDNTHVNTGEYYVTAKIPATNEYYMTDGETSGILDIVPKEVIITPDGGQNKDYGESDPDFTYTADGLVNGDALDGKLERESGEDPGTYQFTLGTLNNSNYSLKLNENSPVFTIVRNGIFEIDGQYIYFIDDVRQHDTDIVKIDGDYYNLVDGVVTPNTVAKNSYGWWYIDENGKVDFSFNGFADNSNGTWYCQNGKVDFSANGVLKGTYNGTSKWGYVKNGKLQKAVTVAKNSYGWWYIGEDGFVDFTANTVAKNSYGWWYCKNGKVQFDYTGIQKNTYGWWRIVNGKVDFTATGVYRNEYGPWYCINGKVQFGYTGKVRFNGRTYYIVKGKAR